MQRYFSEQEFVNDRLTITGDDAKHISRVMRMAVGDEIIVVVKAEAHICKITQIDEAISVVTTNQIITSPEMPVQVTIACGLPKGDKLELITQKGTELGMHALIPFEAKRSIVKWDDKKGVKKVERLQKIAKEAAEQSHRTIIPVIQQTSTFSQLIAQLVQYDMVFLADEEEAKTITSQSFKEHLKQAKERGVQSILCIFGPEGGIDRQEQQQLKASGAHIVALGPRILRAETAPLYALSAISYAYE